LKAEISDSEDEFYCWHFTSHCDDFRQLIYLFYAISFIEKKKEVVGDDFGVFSDCFETLLTLLLLLFGVEEWLL